MFGMLTMLGGVFGRAGAGGAAGADEHEAHPLPIPAIDLPAAKSGETRSAVFAGGCFWCTEGAFAQFRGVTKVVSGYAGDTKETANYRTVCGGDTNHAEAIRITYDPAVIS